MATYLYFDKQNGSELIIIEQTRYRRIGFKPSLGSTFACLNAILFSEQIDSFIAEAGNEGLGRKTWMMSLGNEDTV